MANLDRGTRKDIAENGADCGWYGLTYTSDTVILFDKYEEEIWDALSEMAEGLGEKSVPAMVATFNRIDMASSIRGFKNLCVWAVAESYCQEE